MIPIIMACAILCCYGFYREREKPAVLALVILVVTFGFYFNSIAYGVFVGALVFLAMACVATFVSSLLPKFKMRGKNQPKPETEE